MGVEGLQEEVVPRESAQAERDRHDAEKAAAIKARQIRLGHIPNPEEVEEEAPKTKSRAKPKKTETEE